MNVRLPLVDWSSKTNRERARGGFLLHQRDWKNDVREEQVRIPFFACSPPFFSVISITEKMCLRHLLLCLLVGVIVIVNESEASWDEWWTYDGISGPAFWGLINPQWSLCSKGRRQSPINIEPDKLLFDRHLRPVLVDKHKVSGHLYNTGQFLVFRADREAKVRVNITGGPLAYHYQFEEIYIHYGMDNDHGSEHRINNYAFPAEIQVYGYNAELYHNMSEAQHKSQGLVAISLMVQLGETLNPELQIITSVFNKVIYRGDAAPVRHLSLKSLLPDTNGYMTYEGSTTHPGCWETAVWLILNKPIYVTARELYALRKLMQGPPTTPKAPLGNNSRPLQDLHYRTIRTNIDFRKRPDAKCPSMAQDMHYRANTWQDDGSLSHNVVWIGLQTRNRRDISGFQRDRFTRIFS